MHRDDAQRPIAGNSGNCKTVSRELFKDVDYAGCDTAMFGDYLVRWEKQVRTTGCKSGEAYKHGHVFLRVFAADKKMMTELRGVDVTMQYLPSESPPTPIVVVYNFNLDAAGRDNDDRNALERLSFWAIMSMLRPKLAIIAACNFEIFQRVVGKAAHKYVSETFKLKINEQGCAVFREGGLLDDNNYHVSRIQPHGKHVPASTNTVKRSSDDSLDQQSVGNEVRPRVIVIIFFSHLLTLLLFVLGPHQFIIYAKANATSHRQRRRGRWVHNGREDCRRRR